ncbi:hypothetical protein HDU97_008415 [Phlyctochytrium planicorne]|nr:hypothetical protein HDU97_008415 [Phlyctochytrium planicorne]
MSIEIPSIAQWSGVASAFTQIKDVASNLCWDTNTLAVGAQVFLKECNTVTPTQVFNVISQPDQSSIVTVVHYDKTFCVELGQNGILALQECRSSFSKQQLNLNNQSGASLVGESTCLGPNKDTKVIGAIGCDTKSTINTIPVSTPTEPMPSYDITSLSFEGTNMCIEAMANGTTFPASCNGSPAQNWYWMWGQIRNVENGLCLDAPNASPSVSDAGFVDVKVGDCHGMTTSQLWTKSNENALINNVSFNCIRLANIDNTNKILLGNNMCGSNDSLAGPKGFQALTSFATNFAETQCTTPRVRKDFRDLTSEEQSDFFRALNHLHKIPSVVGRRNRYHDYVAIHGAGARFFHGSPYFLPWHRYFIAVIERDLQTYLQNSTFAFPYWAWGSDATTWQLKETGILTPERFGTTGQSSDAYCVRDGFMNNTWTPTDAECLKRGYDSVKGRASAYTEDYMLAAVMVNPQGQKPYTSYNEFRTMVESAPHNSFHMLIAGNGGRAQMGKPAVSVNDPIFWMHHNNIDRYWQAFQIANPSLAGSFDGQVQTPPYGFNNPTVDVKFEDFITNFNVPVSAAIGVKKGMLCHDFQPYSKSIAAVSVMNAKSPLSRRAVSQRRAPIDGAKTPVDVISTLDSSVAGKLIQADIAIKAAKADRSNLDIAAIPVPAREEPVKLTDEFLDNMKEFMVVDKQKIREMEDASFKLLERVRAETDKILKELFGKDAGNASFDQYAVANKVAIAGIAAGAGKA